MGNSKVLNFLKSITVEPVILISIVAIMFHFTLFRYGLYHTVCLQISGVDCPEMGQNDTLNRSHADLENQAQRRASMFQSVMAAAYVIPAIFADMLLGAWGDRAGRKYNIILGICGWIILIIPTVLLYKYPKTTPMYSIIIGNVIAGVTGFITIILISSFAYIADTVITKETLTVRMAIVQAMVNLGQVFGSLLAGGLSNVMEIAYEELIVLALILISLVLACVLLKQIPPVKMRKICEDKLKGVAMPENQMVSFSAGNQNRIDNNIYPEEHEQREHCCVFVELLVEVSKLIKSIWKTYTKQRPGHAKAYLWILSVAFLVTFLAEWGIRYGVLSLFLQKDPLSFDQAMLGYYDAAHGACVTLGTLFGTMVMKKYLRLSDTALILISISSSTLETILIAFSKKTWMVFLSAVFGAFSYVLKPCCKSFVAKLVDADEVGKAFTAFGIAQNIALLISYVIYTAIYNASLEFFPGMVFLCSAFVFALTFFLVLYMHIDNKRSDHKYE